MTEINEKWKHNSVFSVQSTTRKHADKKARFHERIFLFVSFFLSLFPSSHDPLLQREREKHSRLLSYSIKPRPSVSTSALFPLPAPASFLRTRRSRDNKMRHQDRTNVRNQDVVHQDWTNERWPVAALLLCKHDYKITRQYWIMERQKGSAPRVDKHSSLSNSFSVWV